MSYVRQRRLPMAAINVVPYIDVMLVLLVIFMITAPLLQQGVSVDLPKSDAQPMDIPSEPVVISVTKNGDFYLNIGGVAELVDGDTMVRKVAAFVRRNPKIPVMVGGDKRVAYGRVFAAMALLQQAGVANVGLMSDPLDGGKKR